MPKPPTSNTPTIRVLYALLFIYAGTAGTYQVVNAVSTAIGVFNLRNQVQAPFQFYGNIISSPTAAATHEGLAAGDIVRDLNRSPFAGQAFWQRIRWYADPGIHFDDGRQAKRNETGCDVAHTFLRRT